MKRRNFVKGVIGAGLVGATIPAVASRMQDTTFFDISLTANPDPAHGTTLVSKKPILMSVMTQPLLAIERGRHILWAVGEDAWLDVVIQWEDGSQRNLLRAFNLAYATDEDRDRAIKLILMAQEKIGRDTSFIRDSWVTAILATASLKQHYVPLRIAEPNPDPDATDIFGYKRTQPYCVGVAGTSIPRNSTAPIPVVAAASRVWTPTGQEVLNAQRELDPYYEIIPPKELPPGCMASVGRTYLSFEKDHLKFDD